MVVVIGSGADRVRPALAGVAPLTIAINHEWQSGLASSLTTGLRALGDDAALDGVLVALADQPFVDVATLCALMAEFDSDHRIVAATYQDAVGVPAIFGREHIAELMKLTGDSGAGHWLRGHAAEVRLVPIGNSAIDIDTRSDAARLGDAGLLLAPLDEDA